MEHEKNDEMTEKEMILENNYLLNCLIDLLVEKKVFTDEEFQQKLDLGLNEEEE